MRRPKVVDRAFWCGRRKPHQLGSARAPLESVGALQAAESMAIVALQRAGILIANDRQMNSIRWVRDRMNWEQHMTSKRRDAIQHVILIVAVCGLAAIGIDYIMDTTRARDTGLQRPSEQRVP
jgi:hypothetical protein